MPASRPVGLLVFAFTLGVFVLSLNTVWAEDHTTSLLQLAYAAWTNHSFALGKVGQFTPMSIDDFRYGGSYYSALAPGTAVLSLPLSGIGFVLDGGFTAFGSGMLLSELFVAICNSIATYLVYKASLQFFGRRTAVFLGLAYAFSTISWPFATYYFQSDVTAMFAICAVYFALRISRSSNPRLSDAVICGASAGAAVTTDFVSGILIPIIFVFLAHRFWRDRPSLKIALAFVLIASIGIFLLGLYNYVNFGNPLISPEQAYRNSPNFLGEFSYPLYFGLFLDLFSPLRGLLVYSPILIFGAFGLRRMLENSDSRGPGLLFLACFLGILIPYAMWYDPIGGESFGPRFLVSAIPFLLIPSGFILEGAKVRVWALAYGLYCYGSIVSGLGALTTAVPPVTSVWTSPLLDHNLLLFATGMLDTWWVGGAGSYWQAFAFGILLVAVLGPALMLVLMRERVFLSKASPAQNA